MSLADAVALQRVAQNGRKSLHTLVHDAAQRATFGDADARAPDDPQGVPRADDDAVSIATSQDSEGSLRDFIAGDNFSLADVLLISFLIFGGQVGQQIDPSLKNVAAWYERASTRESVVSTA